MNPSQSPCDDLPATLHAHLTDAVATLTLARSQKRNALSEETILGIETFFRSLDPQVRAVVINAEGDHFCAGLDLSEMTSRDTLAGVAHSRMWHRVFEQIEGGGVPVIAALKGAVVGGGLELAAACHIRVAEESTFYAFPEGRRGIFVGGGGSVRVSRLIGLARMTDMMLTGRRYDGTEGEAIGLSQYVVPAGASDKTAHELAQQIVGNAPQTTFAVLQALPRIAESNPRDGFLIEALMAAIAQGTDDAKARMQSFLDGSAGKVTDS
ncbi:crotonase/enoyl-CoA hydratase family protein [Leekyejoonella antrihumi]|uniref:Crotonase/enoyl-CoA hydratase family protein n=1 Tax=Leekyejoonella antrihumi TaxID=1660198 RepID=A0A563E8M3_9MICO|nr:crotonase/enoyl-CoA hydratase family protein [Leekyejoonella antrihumi]TWP38562.1 crotonase/enoyl-CoA hydratase family protein [Leekyejoonella antrihumi]